MKKFLCIFACIITAVTISGCNTKNEDEPVNTDNMSMTVPEFISETSRQHSQTVSYPSGVEEIDAENLRFKSNAGNYTAIFPKIFSAEDIELTPEDGIYLTTADGKAGLLLDYVKSENITTEDLKKYLEKQYKNIKAEKKDDNVLLFKITSTDKKKNKVTTHLKAVIGKDGYTEAILNYHESESEKYSAMIDKINLK